MRSQFRTARAQEPTLHPLTRNLPAASLADQAGRPLEPEALRAALRQAGVDPYGPVGFTSPDPTTAAWAAHVTRIAGIDATPVVPR